VRKVRRISAKGRSDTMAVSYTAEEVERVILALYSGQNVVEANAWLTQYVATPVCG